MWAGPGRSSGGRGRGRDLNLGPRVAVRSWDVCGEPGSEGKAQGVGAQDRPSPGMRHRGGCGFRLPEELPSGQSTETTPPLCGSPTRRGPSLFSSTQQSRGAAVVHFRAETLSLERRVMTKLLLVPGGVRPAPLGTRRPKLSALERWAGEGAEAAAVGIWLVPDQETLPQCPLIPSPQRFR